MKASVALVGLGTVLLVGCSEPAGPDNKTDKMSSVDKPQADGIHSSAKTVTGSVKDGVFVNKDGKALCPVDGQAMSLTKDVADETVDGVKYYFCMPACADYFKKDTAKFALAKGESTKEVPTSMP